MQSKKNKPKTILRINKNKNICVMTCKQLRQDKSFKNINVGKLPYKTTFRVLYVKIQDDIYNYQSDLSDATGCPTKHDNSKTILKVVLEL